MSNSRPRGLITRTALALALVATALAPTAAMARPGWGDHDGYRHSRGDRNAGAAIATGILGIVLGAAIASNNSRTAPPQERYYDDRPNLVDGCYAPYTSAGFCYPAERYIQQGWRPHRNGWMDPSGRVFSAPFDQSSSSRR